MVSSGSVTVVLWRRVGTLGIRGGIVTTTQLAIVCPSYRDVPSFEILRQRLIDIVSTDPALDGCQPVFIVVDDTAGQDHEIERIATLSDTSVVVPPFNLGHQRGLVYGLRSIIDSLDEGAVIVTMDADGEDRPEDLSLLVGAVLSTPDDSVLVVARRTKRNESIRFRVLYTLFKSMFRILTGTTVRSGNYAAYRASLARRILYHPYFDLCYSSTLVSLDMTLTEVSCPRGTRYAGQSRMSMMRLFMHGVRMLLPFTDRIAVRALTAFSAIFASGVLMGLIVVGIRLFTKAAIPGWTTFTLLGVLILSFIALGNFIVLFAVFSHSRGISLAGLEDNNGRSARNSSATSG